MFIERRGAYRPTTIGNSYKCHSLGSLPQTGYISAIINLGATKRIN
jgi:hypothetical protein